ncbi:MAG: bifunctional oligoribonuclease/PAP phosphatase NrnA [Spirochaetes bacterium]|nr:bifunctional oligoribonuclease/PAP phosphatase NrnA [Spirochaetota bacterium]
MKQSFKMLDEFLNRYDKFIISTHESPDADGLGCEIAFLDFLKQMGKKGIILNSDPTPEICRFLDIDNEITIFTNESQLPDDIEKYALFILDTNDYTNIGSIHKYLDGRVKEKFFIDHHKGSDQDMIDINFVQAEVASASEIIYSIIKYYKKELNFKTAQALYTGIVFDTGSFRYPKTTLETFMTASHLVSKGVDPFKVYEHLYESNSLSSLQLRGKILSSMEILEDGKMISMKLTPEMVKDTKGSFSEGEATINAPFTVKGVIASLLIKQDIEGPVKISMRTKGDLDVAEIAMKNNGGGHKNAAGYKSKLSFDDAYAKAVEDMKTLFKKHF